MLDNYSKISIIKFQDFSDIFEQKYDSEYPMTFVSQYSNQIIALIYSFSLLTGTVWLDGKFYGLK